MSTGGRWRLPPRKELEKELASSVFPKPGHRHVPIRCYPVRCWCGNNDAKCILQAGVARPPVSFQHDEQWWWVLQSLCLEMVASVSTQDQFCLA